MVTSIRSTLTLGLALCALSLGAIPLAAQQPAAGAKPAPAAAKPAAAPAAKPAAAPAPAAQAAPAPDPDLTAFAKAYVSVGLVRDEFDAQLALSKNKTVELQTSLREEMKKKIEQVIQAAGLTVDSYRRIEYSVTVDPARRAAFDQVLAAANAG